MRQWHEIDAIRLWLKSAIKSTHIGSSVRIESHVIWCKMWNLFLFHFILSLYKYNSQYILGCKSLETLRISHSNRLHAATVLKIPGSLLSLKTLTLDEVDNVDNNTLQTLFTTSNLRLIEFGLTETSNINSQSFYYNHNTFCYTIYIEYCNYFSDENLKALANCMHETLVKLKLKNCVNLQNVTPIFENCKFLKYLDLTDCRRIAVPAWIAPVGPAIIFPQSLSNIKFNTNSNFDSVITLNPYLFPW